jgi:hypothetical protein
MQIYSQILEVFYYHVTSVYQGVARIRRHILFKRIEWAGPGNEVEIRVGFRSG